ncbi:hypothetical protein B1B_01436 [mine drainage metagenome]|uniref:DUF4845 domain-containing protein n=1 Tax=mine drainage metagenome TaxID=410659 RepID=T1C7D8_9ZZZZ
MQKNQRGMTFIGWVLSIFLFVVFALAAVRLVPVYLEYLTVRSAVEAAAKSVHHPSRERLFRAVVLQFDVNQITAIHSRDVAITRSHHHFTLTVDYTAHTPFIGNVGFTVHFQHTVRVRTGTSGNG